MFAGVADALEQLEVDQDLLDGYILNVYSSLAKPSGELKGATAALTELAHGGNPEKKLDQMRQLKQMTPEKVKAFAELFRVLSEKGYRGTAAGAGAIQANAELYEAILNPFGAVDASQVVLSDVTEEREDYEAIRFAYENGLMALRGEDTFEPDAEATAGELFAALYVLIGGAPNAETEALETFAQYGLVPEGVTGDTALTFGVRDRIMDAFGTAVGMQFPAIGEGQEETVMTRGQLATDLTIFEE